MQLNCHTEHPAVLKYAMSRLKPHQGKYITFLNHTYTYRPSPQSVVVLNFLSIYIYIYIYIGHGNFAWLSALHEIAQGPCSRTCTSRPSTSWGLSAAQTLQALRACRPSVSRHATLVCCACDHVREGSGLGPPVWGLEMCCPVGSHKKGCRF